MSKDGMAFICAFITTTGFIIGMLGLLMAFMASSTYLYITSIQSVHFLFILAFNIIHIFLSAKIASHVYNRVKLITDQRAYELHRKNKG